MDIRGPSISEGHVGTCRAALAGSRSRVDMSMQEFYQGVLWRSCPRSRTARTGQQEEVSGTVTVSSRRETGGWQGGHGEGRALACSPSLTELFLAGLITSAHEPTDRGPQGR